MTVFRHSMVIQSPGKQTSMYVDSCCPSCTYARSTCFLAGSGASVFTSLRFVLLFAALLSTALGKELASVVTARLSGITPITTAHSTYLRKYSPLEGSSTQYDSSTPTSTSSSLSSIGSHILKGLDPINYVVGDRLPTRIEFIVIFLPAIGIIGLFIHMIPGGPANQSFRVPPSWGPEQEERYSFRHWSRDILVWSILTDLDQRRKAAAVILQLRGGAQELVRSLPPMTIINGGMINGNPTDPMTFVMHALSERYARLGEETRLAALTELMQFTRRGREGIDALIARFDIVRQRANDEGQITMSVQGLAWILLRACQVNDQQLMTVLQPTTGLFPSNLGEYATMCTHLRRMGHIIERSPGNIASQLRNPPGGQAHSAFVTAEASVSDPWQSPSFDPWSSPAGSAPAPEWGSAPQRDGSAHAYWGSAPTHQQPAGTYAAAGDDYDSDNGTDTDTISSVDDNDYELPLPATSTPNEIGTHLFWAYQEAKSRWRNFMGKPVRAVRRFIRRKGKGKGKSSGKGKGKGDKDHRAAFLTSLPDEQIEHVFKGKSKDK